ncbi:MAG: DUF1735 domain-containing protein, partial [Bacteroidales bacterium]|nr:DUF1735 domain-containing protein [Bacteroidales bacterium]
MKKIFNYMLMTALAALTISCQGLKSEEGETGKAEPGVQGVFYADIPGDKEIVEIAPGANRSYTLKACAFQGNVTDIAMNFSFKADADAVEKYNQANGTSYVMCPGSAYEFVTNDVLLPRYGKASTTAKLKVIASGLDQNVTYILPITLDKAKQTESWSVADTLAAYVIFKQSDYDPNGPGTVNNPYPISTVADLKDIDSKTMEGLTVYFRLENDIDLSGEADWKGLNSAPYKQFSLDGAGHTISNMTGGTGLFESVVGEVHDLKISNAKITVASGLPAGILACYSGSTETSTTIKNVYVDGKLVNQKAHGTGGIIGVTQNTTIDACSANVTIQSTKYDSGGIVGYDNSNAEKAQKSVISNCWTSGDISGNRMVGGIVGMLKAECSVINCYSTAEVHAQFQYGGIVGNAIMRDKTGNEDKDPKIRVEKCLAWNKSVYTDNNDDSVHYSSGA